MQFKQLQILHTYFVYCGKMSLTCSSPGLRHWEEKLNDVLLPQKPSPESRLACPVYLKSFVDILLGAKDCWWVPGHRQSAPHGRWLAEADVGSVSLILAHCSRMDRTHVSVETGLRHLPGKPRWAGFLFYKVVRTTFASRIYVPHKCWDRTLLIY